MRCLDSGTEIGDGRNLLGWRPANPRTGRPSQGRCGNCGRWITIVRGGRGLVAVLGQHGDRQPCPVCRSRSLFHHPTDHAEAPDA